MYHGLGLVQIAVELSVVLTLMVRRTATILPGFTSFVFVQMAVDVAEFAAAALYPSVYFRYWMFLDPLTWIFEIWACVEVADRLFDSVSRGCLKGWNHAPSGAGHFIRLLP